MSNNLGMTSDNWMLDDVVKTYKNYWNHKDKLINELTIQKIEYGRTCMAEIFSKIRDGSKLIDDEYNKLDLVLKNKIIELSGSPIDIIFLDYKK